MAPSKLTLKTASHFLVQTFENKESNFNPLWLNALKQISYLRNVLIKVKDQLFAEQETYQIRLEFLYTLCNIFHTFGNGTSGTNGTMVPSKPSTDFCNLYEMAQYQLDKFMDDGIFPERSLGENGKDPNDQLEYLFDEYDPNGHNLLTGGF